MTTARDEATLMAYIDESRKPARDRRTGKVAVTGQHYVVAAAVAMTADTQPLRDALTSIADEINNGNPLRWTDMGSEKRSYVVKAIIGVDAWDGSLYETPEGFLTAQTPDALVRARVLRTAFGDLSTNRGVDHAVLETRSQPFVGFTTHDVRDNRLLASMRDKQQVAPGFTIEHRGKEEPVLWLADILAGMRSDYLCWVDRGTYPVVAHRLRDPLQI